MAITDAGNFTPNPNIVSPGVFSREIDLSGVAQGVADIGAVIVAPFKKGPGFSPITLNNVGDLESRFGTADGTLYGPYTAKQYLQEKGFVTVCRVGALTGYKQKYPWVIYAKSGTWQRGSDVGWLNSGSSIVPATYLTVVTSSVAQTASLSGSVLVGTSSYEGYIQLLNAPVELKFNPVAGTAITGTYSETGSILYKDTTQTPIISDARLYFSASFTGSIASISTSSMLSSLSGLEFLSLLKVQGKSLAISGSTNATNMVLGGDAPFSSSVIVNSKLDIVNGRCGANTVILYGAVSGNFGYYSSFVGSGYPVYEPCTGTWSTGSAEYKVLAVLADTQNATINSLLEAPGFFGSTQSYAVAVTGSDTIGTKFNLELSQSSNAGAYGKYNFSLNSTDIEYITNVFGKDPTAGANYDGVSKREAAYLYKIFEDDINYVIENKTNWQIVGDALPSGSWEGEVLNFTDNYSLDLLNGDSSFGLTNAYTPWIVSQQISAWNGGTTTRFPLFKFWTLSDGTYTNTSWKIEISNVKLAGTVAGSDWGTFTVTVRDYSDTDRKPKILEQFANCNLDPTSANFIARKIGDRYNYIRYDGKIIEFGDYSNGSRYIRVEMSTNNYPETVVPYGFQAYTTPINGALGKWCNPMAYTKASVYSIFPGKYPSGIDFGGAPSGADLELQSLYPKSSANTGHYADNLQYFAPIPSGASVGSNVAFSLDENVTANGVLSGSYLAATLGNAIPAVYDAARENTYVKMRKFVFGFQGGFDGQSPAIQLNIGGDISAGNTQGLNCTDSTTAGSIAYNQCIGALSNADEFDINLIVTPGILYSAHSYVTTLTLEMCEKRGDCFYILDIYQDDGNPSDGQIEDVVSLAEEFDSSYGATYYPWLKIKDTNTNQLITVPPSVVMPAVYAINDRVAGEWWAAAGLNRGGIAQAKQVTDRTTHAERDVLYEARVNPIAAFPGQGIVAWGQKTLQVQSSALDRINVRRLLIEIKKFFASISRYIVFEQNTSLTRNKFLAIVNPYLESIQQRSGLYAFQVVMDESNNTPDIIDRNILYGQILLKPTRCAEFIVLDYSILSTGASFSGA